MNKRMSHPAYNSSDFTLDGFERMVRGLLTRCAGVAPAKSLKKLVENGAYLDFRGQQRLMGIIIPVCFSPSSAVAIGNVLKRIDPDMPATFLFGTGLGYNLTQGPVREAMTTLANQDFEIGLMASIYKHTSARKLHDTIIDDYNRMPMQCGINTLGFHSMGVSRNETRRLADPVVQELVKTGKAQGNNKPILPVQFVNLLSNDFKAEDIAIGTTNGGTYPQHPLDKITNDTKLVLLQVAADWYGADPRTPYARLQQLVGNDVLDKYQDLTGRTLLGAPGTFKREPQPVQQAQALTI